MVFSTLSYCVSFFRHAYCLNNARLTLNNNQSINSIDNSLCIYRFEDINSSLFYVILRFGACNDPLLCGNNTDSLLLCFITGVGTSMIHCLTLVMISAYFDKRRGFANSLANVGGSVGGLVFPVLIRALLDKYDLQGALIVLSGIMLNMVIVGALLRPLDFYKDRRNKCEQLEPNSSIQCDSNGKFISKCDISEGKTYTERESHVDGDDSHEQYLQLVEQKPNTNDRLTKKYIESDRNRSIYSSRSSMSTVIKLMSNSKLDIYGSMNNGLASIQNVQIYSMDGEDIKHPSTKTCSCQKLTNLFRFSLVKNHLFQMCLLVGYLAVYGCVLVLNYLPDFAKDWGVSDDQTALLLSIAAVSEFCGRFAIAWISDSGYIERNHIISISLFISGVSCMFNTFYTNFTSFIIFSIINGCFAGVYLSLFPVLVIDAVGADNLPNALAFLIPIHGFSITVMALVLGKYDLWL